MNTYDPGQLEKKWQTRWEQEAAFKAPDLGEGERGAYILTMFPYPSGSGLHVGHMLGYTGADIIARTCRMQGKKVLFPMGWDSFGLPAENYALKTGVHPAVSTPANIEEYKRQLNQAGLSFDWSKELATSSPDYYRWTQWFFRYLYQKGLAYRKDGSVNWCPKDQTVLANEQVVGGMCERCGTPVVQKQLKQWYFKITDYAERLLTDLDTVDWPERVKAMQRNWIGKSEGVHISFKVQGSKGAIKVFTTRPDTLFGATYLVLAPEHPQLTTVVTPDTQAESVAYLEQAAKKSELERQHLDKTKSGFFTGSYAINPATGMPIPIWVADYVLSTYGTGAIMAVPAHDERDNEFAKAFSLPIVPVVIPRYIDDRNPPQPGKEDTTRDLILATVRDPATSKYLALSWKKLPWTTFITGGIEGGESPEQAARREIAEEAGYSNLRLVKVTDTPVQDEFYAAHKGVNRFAHCWWVCFELESNEVNPRTSEEQEAYDVTWVIRSEVTRDRFAHAETTQFLEWLENREKLPTEKGILINSGEFDGLTSDEATPKVLEKIGAEKVTTYRFRDWLVSRQRFWGAPIPIAYREDGSEYLIPEDKLPVELPMDVSFSPTGLSPLATATEWSSLKDEATGETLTREADTLDTFVCSSWYYLRFPNPRYADGPFDAEAAKQWLPVDTYIGGAEHAVLHLLYARFFTKVLFDDGMIDFSEPFQTLRNQGSILGPDHQKMSKSKGNVINPDDVIAEYGADSFRAYEMFMGPFDVEKPWSTKGIVGVRRFLEKVWKLQEKVTEAEATRTELGLIHKAIKKVTEDVAQCSFNTCISTLMETVNGLQEQPSISLSTYQSLIKLLSPFSPHIAEELWEITGGSGLCSLASWPVFDEANLQSELWECPVQINGKVRVRLQLAAGLSEEAIIAAVEADPVVAEYLAGKHVVKRIVVPGRLISYVIS